MPKSSHHIPRAIAAGIVAAAPELPARVDALLRHALGRQAFGEAAVLLERAEQMLYLPAQHQDQPAAD